MMSNTQIFRNFWKKIKTKNFGLSIRMFLFTFFFILLTEVIITLFVLAITNKEHIASHIHSATLIRLLNKSKSPSCDFFWTYENSALTLDSVNNILAIIEVNSNTKLSDLPNSLFKSNYKIINHPNYGYLYYLGLTVQGILQWPSNKNIIIRTEGTCPGYSLYSVIAEQHSQGTNLIFFGTRLLMALIMAFFVSISIFFIVRSCIVNSIKHLGFLVTNFAHDPLLSNSNVNPPRWNDEIKELEQSIIYMKQKVQNEVILRQRLSDLGLAFSKVNHDLRNVLATATLISGKISRIANKRIEAFSPKLESSLKHATHFCNLASEYAKYGELKPNKTKVLVKNIVDEVFESLRILPEAKDIIFNNHVFEKIYVSADNEHVYRIFSNIVWNAIDALNKLNTKMITVNATIEHNKIHIRFIDNGPGIPDALKNKVFQPFIGGQSGGSGLGLAIAKDLVEANQGKIKVGNTKNGTTIIITFDRWIA